MLAMLHGVVHAAGAEYLPADGAINGVDDVMLQASLQFVGLHELLSQLDGPADVLLELAAEDFHPLYFLLVSLLALTPGLSALTVVCKASIHLTINHYSNIYNPIYRREMWVP